MCLLTVITFTLTHTRTMTSESDILDMLTTSVKDVVYDALTILQTKRSLHTQAVHTKLNAMINKGIMSNAISEYMKNRI